MSMSLLTTDPTPGRPLEGEFSVRICAKGRQSTDLDLIFFLAVDSKNLEASEVEKNCVKVAKKIKYRRDGSRGALFRQKHRHCASLSPDCLPLELRRCGRRCRRRAEAWVKLGLSNGGVKPELLKRLREYEKTNPNVFVITKDEEKEEEKNALQYSGRFSHEKEDTKDYHGMFDHDYMVQWLEHALKDLDEQGIKNTIIVMDNAKYHKCLPKDIPPRNAKKGDIIAALKKYEIVHDAKDNKVKLVNKLYDYIDANVDLVLVDMVKKAGHELIFSPPHHSDLQAIEIIWAITKQEVARQYDANTKKKDVFERLNAAFKKLGPRQVNGSFKKTEEAEKKMREHFQHVEEAEEKAAEDGNVNSEEEEEVDDYGEGVPEGEEEEED